MLYHVHPSLRKLFHPARFNVFRNQWDRAKVAKLPMEYQKFYTEWMDSEHKEAPVHWIPRVGKWERNPDTGEVKQIHNVPIQVNYPLEMHHGLWGGEGVIQGMIKRGKWRSPVPRFWSPSLHRNIVYSEILDVHLSVVVTVRAMKLIDDHHGLDNYLLTTPAYDLKSLLALKLKKKIMLALLDRNFCKDDPQRQEELLEEYKSYLLSRNELEWYALSVNEAEEKMRQMKEAGNIRVPLKVQFRAELIEQLKRDTEVTEGTSEGTSSWMSRLNPFSRGQEAR